ncbi:putative calcium homeostasis protein Regucalcin [Fonsecaea pedrosoi]|nr:putative calcium homeostasis protein Regucalcin [Fonsecaea pedrosoi]
MGIQEWTVTEAYYPSKCSLGEGPYYTKERNELRYMDINNKKLFIIDLAKGPESVKIIDTSQPIGVTANIEGVDSSEVILAGAKDGVTKFNLKTGEHEYVAKYWKGADAEDKARRMRSNDGAVDTQGRFWVEAFVDPEISQVTDEGCLLRLDHDGTLQTMHEGMKIPNGITWNAGDSTMFLTDSPPQNVYAFDYDARTGAISNKRIFFHLDEEGVHPDGHAMDVEGNIWHACYGGSKVIRISPQGVVTGIVHLPTRNITCPTFAGTALFITSARESQPDKYPDSAKFAGNLFRVDVGVEGMPKYRARLD